MTSRSVPLYFATPPFSEVLEQLMRGERRVNQPTILVTARSVDPLDLL